MAAAPPADPHLPRAPAAGPDRLGWAWLLLAMCVAVWGTAWHIVQRPAIGLTDCLRGQEVALHQLWLQGRGTPAAEFLAHDESAYVRMAEQLARGAVATDYLGDFLEQVRRAGDAPALWAASPMARLARDLAAPWPAGRPSFVAYRSAVFAAWGAPVVAALGCNDRALTALRASLLPWRAAGVLLAGWLAWTLAAALAPRWRRLALVLASSALALDALVNAEASHFMPDTPALALLLAALLLLVRMLQRPGLPVALVLGALCGLAALVKADLMYVLPLGLGAGWLAVPPARRRALLRPLGLALLVHALVLSAWAWRNHGHTGAWVVTTKDSINLFLGNSPDAPSRGYHFGTSAEDWAALEALPASEADTLRRHGPEVALKRGLQRLAVARLLEDPARTLRMTLARAALYLNSGEFRHYPLLGAMGQALASGVMLAALAMAACALWPAPRQAAAAAVEARRAMRPLAVAWCAGLGLVSLVGFEMRYQLHLYAMGGVLAGVAVATCGAWLSRRGRRAFAGLRRP